MAGPSCASRSARSDQSGAPACAAVTSEAAGPGHSAAAAKPTAAGQPSGLPACAAASAIVRGVAIAAGSAAPAATQEPCAPTAPTGAAAVAPVAAGAAIAEEPTPGPSVTARSADATRTSVAEEAGSAAGATAHYPVETGAAVVTGVAARAALAVQPTPGPAGAARRAQPSGAAGPADTDQARVATCAPGDAGFPAGCSVSAAAP